MPEFLLLWHIFTLGAGFFAMSNWTQHVSTAGSHRCKKDQELCREEAEVFVDVAKAFDTVWANDLL